MAQQISDKIRLNKAIADSGFCSRRKADEYIKAGRVEINGKKIAEPGLSISQSDIIAIDGKILERQPRHVYLMLNKPVGTICSRDDPQRRKTVYDCLPEKYKSLRLFSIGRLDYFSEGLLLLTNDGILAQYLAHPRYSQAKTYEVRIRGKVADEIIISMRNGLILSDSVKLMPAEITRRQLPSGDTVLFMTLRQGINRQIRRMCELFDLTILRLKRIRQGKLELGELASGECRELSKKEISGLKQLSKNRCR